MGKTSSNQEKKKKTKVRKLINRTKNGLQCVRKFCRQHVMPVMLSTAIIGGVIFGTYLRATATGVEELYYTYWDLVSSILPRKATICRSRTEMTRSLLLTV